eukprot:scaffold87_cov388-Prasinococcus_capsulatus_cf.AAC.11
MDGVFDAYQDKSFTLQEEHKRVRRDLWPSQRIRQAVFAVQQALQQQALNGSGEYISVHADQKLQTNIPVYIASDERSAVSADFITSYGLVPN